MRQPILCVLLASIACGPIVTDVADGSGTTTAGGHEEQECLPCAQEVCDAELEACRNDAECSCIAECVDEWDGPVEDDPFFVCADFCGKLELPQWRELSECASEMCGMCPAMQGS
ncbi:hypothetical protein [Paraliomyxa miuraensis]|uniref:hypothetical protein n=1 Tax=Paraliomyxa miuraensis TaxID=376150 RepID=UPI00225A5522|nr:hypothetical protein [Paraliomyxa miuraensis]MCX4240824.1 hypothetical protein [Paraliomyxa miuraensis]